MFRIILRICCYQITSLGIERIKTSIELTRLLIKLCVNVFTSRNMNEPCMYMDFFDNHDMWHFFSATALFLAFIFLLTIDDDLLLEERKNIKVF